jgi:hypothetical protein
MRYIARLKYSSKTAFINSAKLKGLLDQEGNPTQIVNEIVHIGSIPDVSGYHVDVDLKEPVSFGSNITTPSTPQHGVLWAQGAVIITD